MVVLYEAYHDARSLEHKDICILPAATCSETSTHKIQTPGNHPKERIQHSENGENLNSRIYRHDEANSHFSQCCERPYIVRFILLAYAQFRDPTTCYTADRQFTPCVAVRKQRGAVDCRHVLCMHMIPTAVHMTTVTVTASQFVVNGPLVAGVFLDAATLTEVFPCFFLGCKANARV